MEIILPTGYTAKPVSLKDAASVVDLYNAFGLAYLGKVTDTIEELTGFWQMPGFNLATDACMVLGPDGGCAGIADFWDRNEKHILYGIRVVVHPRHESQGIGSYLFNWIEKRAQNSLPLAPAGANVKMQQGVDVRMTKNIEFLSSHGYKQVRNFYHMHIALDQPPPAAILPEGFSIRPFQGEDERRALLRALYDSFHDHWGFIEEPFEKYYQRWMYRLTHFKEMDSSLWYAAFQDGAIAGGCISANSVPEDPEMGWIHTLGIRRAYRKQGLGLAFLNATFGEFYRRGIKRAGLGVDASSLTGAVRLYEKAGMHVARQFITFEKILREGEELSTQQLSAE
jgi:mycothiol synthase